MTLIWILIKNTHPSYQSHTLTCLAFPPSNHPSIFTTAGKAAKHVEPPVVLSAQSQSLDLVSPAGRYRLDMSHPASYVVVDSIRELQKKLEGAVQGGKVVGLVLSLLELQLNARQMRADKLEGLSQLGQVQA